MAQVLYACKTEGAIALAAATAKSVIGIQGGSDFGVNLKKVWFGCDGVTVGGANVDSFDIQAGGAAGPALRINQTGTMVYNGRTSDTRLVIDTRIAGAVSTDSAVIQFQKAGVAKTQVGLNFSGSNIDTLEFYIQGVGLAMQITQLQSVLIGKSAPGLAATDGFPYIPSDAGTPTGVPTAKAGFVPMKYDGTAHKLWIYDGGWKGVNVT